MILDKPEHFVPGETVVVIRKTGYYDDELDMSETCIRKQFVLMQKLAEVDEPTSMKFVISSKKGVGSGITDKDFVVRSLLPDTLEELLPGDRVYRSDGMEFVVVAQLDMLYFFVDAETRTLPMACPMTIQALESFGFSLTPPQHE